MASGALQFQVIQGGNTSKTQSNKKQTPTLKIVRDPLQERARGVSEGQVKLVTLFNSIDLQKDYENCTMVYDGRRFRKIVRGSSITRLPSKDDLIRFIRDILKATETEKQIKDFIEKNPLKPALVNTFKR